MSDQITLDYDQMKVVAKQFGADADRIQNLIKSIDQALSSLRSGGYRGGDAERFFSEMDDKIVPALQRLRDALTNTETYTNQILEDFKKAEEAAKQAFNASPFN